MSLPTDIIQFFGTGSVPVIVAGSVLGVFELGERFASQRAKDALSRWLLTFDVRKTGALPDGTQELFERIFGERHFSLKCFVRSAVFSLGAIAFMIVVSLLIDPDSSRIFPLRYKIWDPWIFIATFLTWNIVIDYISLFKTRIVLWLLSRMHRQTAIAAIAILALDYVAYRIIFTVGNSLAVSVSGFFDSEQPITRTWKLVKVNVEDITSDFGLLLTYMHPGNWSFVMFWAGFAPSLWMWLYVAALFVTRGLLRSEKLVSWLRWALDIEKAPFRSIGAVAATLAFIASVAIILVSAEVSRISAAS